MVDTYSKRVYLCLDLRSKQLAKPNNITVLIVDNHQMTRTGLTVILRSIPGIVPIGEAETGEEAIELVTELEPDIILMDIEMHGMTGLEATRRLIAERPDPPYVLILTTFDNKDDYLVEAHQSGASGYVGKDAAKSELGRKIKNVALHGVQEWPDHTRQLVPHYEAAKRHHAKEVELANELSVAEIDVLALRYRGYLLKEIARERNVGESTVKAQVALILKKLEVRTSKDAARLARRVGLIRD